MNGCYVVAVECCRGPYHGKNVTCVGALHFQLWLCTVEQMVVLHFSAMFSRAPGKQYGHSLRYTEGNAFSF